MYCMLDKLKKDSYRSQFIIEKYKEMSYTSEANKNKILSESKKKYFNVNIINTANL